MKLKEFKDYIESFEIGAIFNYGISTPYSWRGYFEDVVFEIIEGEYSREEILDKINYAYNNSFNMKGGIYTFDNNTIVHFEGDDNDYSDGEYVKNWIYKIELKLDIFDEWEASNRYRNDYNDYDINESLELYLIKLLFNIKH